MRGNIEDNPSFKCLAKAFLFSSGAQEATQYVVFPGIEIHNFEIIEGDGMIYHNLYNLVLDISE